MKTYVVGSKVGVIKHGHTMTSTQGIYTVTKSNKIRVHLVRDGDGYERIFSVKTGIENSPWCDRYSTPSIVSIEEYERYVAINDRTVKINNMWTKMQSASQRRPSKEALQMIKDAIEALEEVIV